jgi:hypothetical protein
MYKYIVHPESGRKVNVDSHLGRNILSAYAQKADLTGNSTDSEETFDEINQSRKGGGGSIVYGSAAGRSEGRQESTYDDASDDILEELMDGKERSPDVNSETVDEKAQRMLQNFDENTVIIKSRNVSKYQEGQRVEKIGKDKNITGTVVAVLESGELTHNLFRPGKLLVTIV